MRCPRTGFLNGRGASSSEPLKQNSQGHKGLQGPQGQETWRSQRFCPRSLASLLSFMSVLRAFCRAPTSKELPALRAEALDSLRSQTQRAGLRAVQAILRALPGRNNRRRSHARPHPLDSAGISSAALMSALSRRHLGERARVNSALADYGFGCRLAIITRKGGANVQRKRAGQEDGHKSRDAGAAHHKLGASGSRNSRLCTHLLLKAY